MPAKPPATGRRLITTVLLVSVLPACTALSGCRGFLDDQKEMWTDLYKKPDPLTVVKSPAASADRKAKYIAQLQEPNEHGGSSAQQDEVIQLLTQIAISDPAPTCRLQAIHRLGSFKDPRRVSALQAAYYKATAFPDEVNSQIRQQALRALGDTRDPSARADLIRVARTSARENNHFDQQLTLDERLTAIRALANYKDAEVAEALLHVVRTEKDVALRDRAHQSLESVMGRRLPTDPKTLEQALAPTGDNPASTMQPGNGVQLLNWGLK
jgi:hypothetical protein